MLSIIVAAARNNAIGNNNELLWHMPADLKFFKETTLGHPVIMGRKTYESVGKPLPKRRNIVITRNADFSAEGVEVCHSLEEALGLLDETEENFIVGGAEIYKMSLPYCDRIYFTRIEGDFEADTFFPSFDPEEWQLKREEKHAADDKNPYDYSFLTYERIKK
jgi:dihydrofolate reductase